MQNEKNFFYRCKKFEYIHDYEIFFTKSDNDTLEYVILDNNVYLYEIDYTISSSIKVLHIAKKKIVNFNCVLNSLRLRKLLLRSFTSNSWSI